MRFRNFALAAFAGIFLLGSAAFGQCVSLTTMGSAHTQNFNTLSNTAGSTTNNLTITGWFMTESGGGARDNEQYAVDTGASTTGDTYSYGAAAATERALGQLRSGTLIPTFGACFTNNTGQTISRLDVSYVGEEWRLGTAARTDQMNFEYSLNATDLVTGTWTNVAALNFVTPDTATTGAKDGNSAADRTALSSTISGLSIANGATYWIRWSDVDASGADDGLAIDDFSLTPQAAAVAPNLSINDVSLNEGNAGTTNFSFTVSLSSPAPAGGVSFDIATADGTAVQPSDYTQKSASGAIAAGQSTATFTVVVNGDTTVETNETFFVNVTNVTGATVLDGQGQGTIVNDDAADTTAPDTTITFGPSALTNSTSATFNFSGNDGAGSGVASFECSLDNGAFATCVSPRTYTGLADGAHTFAVRAIDNAGNTDQTPATYNWSVDTVAPDTVIVSTPAAVTPSTSATFAFNDGATTPSRFGRKGISVTSYECKLDDGSFLPCTSPQSYSGLSDGQHTFLVRAIDSVGNTDATPASYSWIVDSTAPETTINSGPTGTFGSADATFTFGATDATQTTFECSLDSAAFAACVSPKTYSGLADGLHSFSVRATDAAGNVDASPATATWTIDTVAPAVAYEPLTGTNDTGSRVFTVTVNDTSVLSGVGLNYSVTPAGTSGISSCTALGGADYECTIPGVASGSTISYYVTAADTAGNSTTFPVFGAPFAYAVGSAVIPAGTYAGLGFAPGSTLGGDVTVKGPVSFLGISTWGASKLILGCDATVTSSTAPNSTDYMAGTVEKQFCSATGFTFPVGAAPVFTAGEKAPEGLLNPITPLSVEIVSIDGPASLTVSVVDSVLPGADATKSLSRYWDVVKTGTLTANMTFRYLDQDVVGDESTYRVMKASGNSISYYVPSSVSTEGNSFTALNVSSFSRWTAGAFVPTAGDGFLAGRVRTASGEGIRNAYVTISGGDLAAPVTVRTSTFGSFRFDDLEVGQTYLVTVTSVRYGFADATRVVNLVDNLEEFDFVANPQ